MDYHLNQNGQDVGEFPLEELRRRPLPPGAPVVAMAFGPGLTLYACLLRWT